MLKTNEKITILLAEYNALRAQMLQRNTVINQWFAISGTIILSVATLLFTQSIMAAIVLVIVLMPILFFAFRLNTLDMIVTAERLEELRLQINGYANEELIKHVDQKGRSTLGYEPDCINAARPFEPLGKILSTLWHRLFAN